STTGELPDGGGMSKEGEVKAGRGGGMGTALVIRHVAFEDLGTFEARLTAADFSIRYIEAGMDDLASLDAADPDLLIVLGGPIGANDEATYPFLIDELRILERRLEWNRP